MPLAAFPASFSRFTGIGYGLLLSAKPFDFPEVGASTATVPSAAASLLAWRRSTRRCSAWTPTTGPAWPMAWSQRVCWRQRMPHGSTTSGGKAG